MKRPILLFPILACVIVFSGCLKQPGDNPRPKPDENPFFDFATTKEFQLAVDYKINYAIDFEVYTEYPYTTGPVDQSAMRVFKGISSYAEKDQPGRIEPVFRAITNDKGSFSDKITMPAAVDKVWIHTKYMGVPEVVEVAVDGQNVTFTNVRAESRTSRAMMTRGNSSAPSNVKLLGEWDNYGVPLYKLAEKAYVPTTLFTNLMYTLQEGKNVSVTHPELLGKENKIVLKEKSSIKLVFVHDGGLCTSPIGYYSYTTGTTPTASSINRIIAFPNASYTYDGGNLSCGDQVELKYWNPTTQAFEAEFPADQTIGFFIYPYYYNTSTNAINSSGVAGNLPIGFSNTEFNASKKQQILLLNDPTYTKTANNEEVMILAIEDNPGWDYDFNDVVLMLQVKGSSNDVPNLDPDPDPDPQPDPIDNYLVFQGTLAFEDLWPFKGDYDMNDVVIEYKSTVMRDKNNNVIGMIDSLCPRWSGAEFHNGFAYELGLAYSQWKDLIQVKVRTNYNATSTGNVDDGRRMKNGWFGTVATGVEQGPAGSKIVIPVFEDIKDMVPDYNNYRLGGLYPGLKPKPTPQYYFTIVTSFGSAADLAKHPSLTQLTSPPYNPFTVVTDGKEPGHENDNSPQYRRRREIHLPYKAPTARAMELGIEVFFRKGEDRSYGPWNYYYVSSLNYPWAINIPVYNWNFPIEEKRVDNITYGYPRFASWVESGGVQDRDWYNFPGTNIGNLP